MEDNNVAVFLLKNLGKTWGQTECSPISDLFPPAVDDFETVRASEFNQVQQLLGRSPQQLQKQPLENCKFLQLSGTLKIWFGARGWTLGPTLRTESSPKDIRVYKSSTVGRRQRV